MLVLHPSCAPFCPKILVANTLIHMVLTQGDPLGKSYASRDIGFLKTQQKNPPSNPFDRPSVPSKPLDRAVEQDSVKEMQASSSFCVIQAL